MPFDFGSVADFASNIDFGDIDFGNLDLGSLVDDFGTEFLSSDFSFTDFGVSFDSISDLGGWSEIGSFAGDASWFDSFNPGAILDSLPSVGDFNLGSITDSLPSLSSLKDGLNIGDFNLGSITDSLPSLSSLKDGLSTVTSSVQSISKTAQSAIKAYEKVAPAVNLASSALGIQNPINQIIQPIKQATSLASGLASNATSISKGLDSAVAGYDRVTSTASKLLTDIPTSVSGAYDRVTSTASNLFTTSPTASNAVDKATGLPINTPREVDAYGLSILNAQEDAQLTRNATLINSFADAGQQPSSVQVDIARARAAGEIPPEQPLTADEQANEDAINRIAANRANNVGPDAFPTPAENIASLREAGFGPVPVTAEEQANEDAINRIELTRNAASVNSSTDPGTQSPIGYSQAIANSPELLATQADIENSIRQNTRVILDSNMNIEEMQQNLLDPDLSDAQRERLQLQIDANRATAAEASDNIFQNQQSLSEVNAQLASGQQIIAQTVASSTATPGAVSPDNDTYYSANPSVTVNSIVGNPGAVQGIAIGPLVSQLKQQQTLRDLRQTKAQSSDWRVRLRLAPGATYLYNDPNGAGILDPLKATDGVIFPYTPAIETAYKANYDAYDLTHSNFRGYFYKSSYVDAVNLRCTFTAQDTQEANYLLATIHFFRSVTKMFYGQDPERGSPPPLVFLSGLGDYQFSEHPSVVSQFNYTLPADVDYIRAYSTLDMSTNLLNNRTRTSIPGNPVSYAANRLLNSGLFTGAQASTRTIGNLPIKEPTYVPTKIEISITLLPIQSRQQISTEFSLKGFANGNLLKGGFW